MTWQHVINNVKKRKLMLDAEKMKKMLLDPNYTLSGIAEEFNYDSLQALSSDFKKLTGMTPSKFRRLNEPERELDVK